MSVVSWLASLARSSSVKDAEIVGAGNPLLASPDAVSVHRANTDKNGAKRTHKMTWSRKPQVRPGCTARDLNPEPAG